jgi:hypothetical protein
MFSDRDGKFGAARRKVLVSVLTQDKERLVENQILAENLGDTLPDEPDPDVKHVVFVVPGTMTATGPARSHKGSAKRPHPLAQRIHQNGLPFWKGVSKISPILLGLLIVLAVVILFAILWPVFAAGTTVAEAVYRTILALLYLLVLRFVVTRV